jgi:hypothetical protein
MKKVIVEYRYENYFKEDENEIGVLFENGKVLVADAIGGTSIYNSHPSPNPGCVVVNLDKDGKDYLSDNPELLVNLILTGGAA